MLHSAHVVALLFGIVSLLLLESNLLAVLEFFELVFVQREFSSLVVDESLEEK